MNPQNSPNTPSGDLEAGGSHIGADTRPEARQKIADTAREAAAKVKSATGQTVARAREHAENFAAEKREAAAGRIGGYSSAVHESARSLEESDPNIAWFTHQAADKIQHMADYIRSCDISSLRDDCSSIARRHPLAFFGGMFITGLLVGNMLKASPRRLSGGDSMEESMGSPAMSESDLSTPADMTLSERTPAPTWGGA